MFEDVPLDLRHHKFKVRPKFPKEWRMSEERRRELEDTRQKSLLLDQAKEERQEIVDGVRCVEEALARLPGAPRPGGSFRRPMPPRKPGPGLVAF